LSEPGPFGVHDRPEETRPARRPPPAPPPARPGGRSRYGWVVGVAIVLALAYITLNTLRTEGPGSTGLAPGERLPPFAMPLADSRLEGDANVATRPGSGPEGSRPACEVRGPEILNSCELAERGPVVLAFFGTRSKLCEDQIDVLERVRRRFPDVGFAAVAIRGDRDDLRRVMRKRGWGLPVGYDHDGAVANTYAVAVCPTITFAFRGGEVQDTTLRLQSERAVAARVELLRTRR
jgi:hypothetical protein